MGTESIPRWMIKMDVLEKGFLACHELFSFCENDSEKKNIKVIADRIAFEYQEIRTEQNLFQCPKCRMDFVQEHIKRN